MRTLPAALLAWALLAGCISPAQPLEAASAFELRDFTIEARELRPHESLAVGAEVANTGSTVGQVSVFLRVDGVPVERPRVLQLFPGKAESVRFAYLPPHDGLYDVEVALSTGDFRNATVRVGTPDLRVLGLRALQEPVVLGEPLSVYFSVVNIGTGHGKAVATALVDALEVGRVGDIALDPGDARAATVTFQPLKRGRLDLAVVLDSGASASLTTRVTAPELKARAWNWDHQGCESELRVTVTAANDGDGPAREAVLALALHGEGAPVVRVPLGTLDAGAAVDGHGVLFARDRCGTPDTYQLDLRLEAANAAPYAWTTAPFTI